jgi:hypothetical protein
MEEKLIFVYGVRHKTEGWWVSGTGTYHLRSEWEPLPVGGHPALRHIVELGGEPILPPNLNIRQYRSQETVALILAR